MKRDLLRRILIKCIHTVETEPVVECGDCGGSRKVATYHNPSSLVRKKVVFTEDLKTLNIRNFVKIKKTNLSYHIIALYPPKKYRYRRTT